MVAPTEKEICFNMNFKLQFQNATETLRLNNHLSVRLEILV